MPTNRTYSTVLQVGGETDGEREAGRWVSEWVGVNKALNIVSRCRRVNALRACVDLLVELQVKGEGRAEGLHQEAALGQMDGLREGGRRRCKKQIRKKGLRFTFTFYSFTVKLREIELKSGHQVTKFVAVPWFTLHTTQYMLYTTHIILFLYKKSTHVCFTLTGRPHLTLKSLTLHFHWPLERQQNVFFKNPIVRFCFSTTHN